MALSEANTRRERNGVQLIAPAWDIRLSSEIFAGNPTAMIVRLEKAGWAYRDEDGVPALARGLVEITGLTTLPFV